MKMLYEKVFDDLLINQEKLTKTERVKLFVTLSNLTKYELNYNKLPYLIIRYLFKTRKLNCLFLSV